MYSVGKYSGITDVIFNSLKKNPYFSVSFNMSRRFDQILAIYKVACLYLDKLRSLMLCKLEKVYF